MERRVSASCCSWRRCFAISYDRKRGLCRLQEFIEQEFAWESERMHAIRGAIEEGSQLLGMQILLGSL